MSDDMDKWRAQHVRGERGGARYCRFDGYSYPCPMARMLTAHDEMHAALGHTYSRLSLLRHRGDIQWGFGIGTAYECDEILGQAARVLGYGPGGSAR